MALVFTVLGEERHSVDRLHEPERPLARRIEEPLYVAQRRLRISHRHVEVVDDLVPAIATGRNEAHAIILAHEMVDLGTERAIEGHLQIRRAAQEIEGRLLDKAWQGGNRFRLRHSRLAQNLGELLGGHWGNGSGPQIDYLRRHVWIVWETSDRSASHSEHDRPG